MPQIPIKDGTSERHHQGRARMTFPISEHSTSAPSCVQSNQQIAALIQVIRRNHDAVPQFFQQPRPAHRSHPVTIETSMRSEEHTSELQSRGHLVCRLLLEKKKK